MSRSDDTQLFFTLVCSGCDCLTQADDTFYLRNVSAGPRHLPGTYCRACAERWEKNEPLPKSAFPRLASFSIDGKTWTACDLRDSPS